MCGRVRLSSDYSEIKIKLKFAPNAAAPNFEPSWNKPPTEPMLVAIRSVDGERVPKMMKWGLVPHWARDDKLQYSTFNARAEDLANKPAFRTTCRSASADNRLKGFRDILRFVEILSCRAIPCALSNSISDAMERSDLHLVQLMRHSQSAMTGSALPKARDAAGLREGHSR
jgi:hypothetical protein